MNTEERLNFIKMTERMVEPERVSFFTFLSRFLQKIPLSWQLGMTKSAAKKDPYISFIVEPYSFFLAYEMSDQDNFRNLIPSFYRIIPVAMFEGSEPRPSILVGAFNLHTSFFWGSRIEIYLIAEDTRSGLLTWIILDYETNTISNDPGRGLIPSSTHRCIVTTAFSGDVVIDVKNRKTGNRFALTADLDNTVAEPLNQRLWIEGNLSVDYAGTLNGGKSEPFGLIFDPGEVESALRIPIDNLSFETDSLFSSYTGSTPYEAACFPFAQHFITTSLPRKNSPGTITELETSAADLSRKRKME